MTEQLPSPEEAAAAEFDNYFGTHHLDGIERAIRALELLGILRAGKAAREAKAAATPAPQSEPRVQPHVAPISAEPTMSSRVPASPVETPEPIEATTAEAAAPVTEPESSSTPADELYVYVDAPPAESDQAAAPEQDESMAQLSIERDGLKLSVPMRILGRDAVVVEMPDGSRQAFYRSSGLNSDHVLVPTVLTAEERRSGKWLPFDGVGINFVSGVRVPWLDKERFTGSNLPEDLRRYGTEAYRMVGEKIDAMDLAPADTAPDGVLDANLWIGTNGSLKWNQTLETFSPEALDDINREVRGDLAQGSYSAAVPSDAPPVETRPAASAAPVPPAESEASVEQPMTVEQFLDLLHKIHANARLRYDLAQAPVSPREQEIRNKYRSKGLTDDEQAELKGIETQRAEKLAAYDERRDQLVAELRAKSGLGISNVTAIEFKLQTLPNHSVSLEQYLAYMGEDGLRVLRELNEKMNLGETPLFEINRAISDMAQRLLNPPAAESPAPVAEPKPVVELPAAPVPPPVAPTPPAPAETTSRSAKPATPTKTPAELIAATLAEIRRDARTKKNQGGEEKAR